MLGKSLGFCLSLLVLAQPAFAQKAQGRPVPGCNIAAAHAAREAPSDREIVNAKFADLTVRTALSNSAPQSDREMLAILLLMSVPPRNGG
jgi:hypothetical protein